MTTDNTPNTPSLTASEIRRLKGIGHELKPVVLIGNNGASEAVLEEIERALNDHELIKIKIPAGTKDERDSMSNHIAEVTGAQVIQHIGRMVLLLRRNPNATARLSNLIRHTE